MPRILAICGRTRDKHTSAVEKRKRAEANHASDQERKQAVQQVRTWSVQRCDQTRGHNTTEHVRLLNTTRGRRTTTQAICARTSDPSMRCVASPPPPALLPAPPPVLPPVCPPVGVDNERFMPMPMPIPSPIPAPPGGAFG